MAAAGATGGGTAEFEQPRATIGDLLRLAVEEDTLLYLPGICLLLERVYRENGEEEASEALLSGLLGQLQDPAKTSVEKVVVEWWNKNTRETWEYLWQLSAEAPATSGRQTLASFVCDCRHFQAFSCQLAVVALAAGRVCGFWSHDLENRFVQQFAGRFRSVLIDRFINPAVPNSNGPTEDVEWWDCLRNLSLLLTTSEISTKFLAPLTVKEDDLCRGPSGKMAVQLAHSLPGIFHAAYKKWWQRDEKLIKSDHQIPTADKKGAGLLIKCGHLLDSSLLALGLILKHWNGIGTVQESSLQTVLRLSYLHLRNLSKIVDLVPEEMPIKLWYVIINSAICLHSMLERLHSILTPPTETGSLFLSLLQEVTEFTDTLVSNTITHHIHLIQYSILQDPDSENWFQSQPYHEGERCSLPIQMWHYYLCGLRDDLWETGRGGGGGGGRVFVRVLREVFSRSISFLAGRYLRVTPSYERTSLMRTDILVVMTVIEDFLSYTMDPTPSSSSPSSSSSLTASYFSLLHTLTIVTSPLHILSTSLNTTSTISSQPHLLKLPAFSCLATSNHISDDVIQILKFFVSLPFSSWHLLIKLLAQKRNRHFLSLLITVATSEEQKEEEKEVEEGTREIGEFLKHLLSSLSHCVNRPTLLFEALSILDSRNTDRTEKDSFKMLCSTEWLLHWLKGPLQRCFSEWSAKFTLTCHHWWDETAPIDDYEDESQVSTVTDQVIKLVNVLEDTLVSQLPCPVSYALFKVSGDEGNGKKMVKVLVDFLLDWVSQIDPCVSSLFSSTFSISSLLSQIVSGYSQPSTLPPPISKALKKGYPVIEKRLQSFAKSLASLHSIPEEDDMEPGHELVADILEQVPSAQNSLHYLHKWFQDRKEILIEALQSLGNDQSKQIPRPSLHQSDHLTLRRLGFNPFHSGLFIGSADGSSRNKRKFQNQEFTRPSLPWEELISFSLSLLSHDQLVKLVRNRFEFQPQAQLQGIEPQLVEKINNYLLKQTNSNLMINY